MNCISGFSKGEHTRNVNLVKLDYRKINKQFVSPEAFNDFYNKSQSSCLISVNNDSDEEGCF